MTCIKLLKQKTPYKFYAYKGHFLYPYFLVVKKINNPGFGLISDLMLIV